MAPKKSKTTKAPLKKAGTMAATAADGQEFLKQAWGEEKLNRVNALLEARDKSEGDTSGDAASAPSSSAATTTTSATASTSATTTKAKAKPKLSKAHTMKSTAQEGKSLIGKEVLGDTRSETKRRQAAVKAKKTLEEVTKSASGRKPALKRLGTMANTAREGKAYIKRTAVNKKTGSATTGRKRTGGRAKNTKK